MTNGVPPEQPAKGGPALEPGQVEVWRGGVNTWECDEMGHMNVRFYVVKAMEGLAGLAAELGMSHAFAPHATATLMVREHHIRFLREAHPGAALSMSAGVLEMGDSDARLIQVLRHADGAPAAAFQTRVSHVTARDGRAYPWPRRVRERAADLACALPDYAAARGVAALGGEISDGRGLAEAEAMGLARIGLGALGPQDCDVFGRMRPEQFIGRVSDGVTGLVGPWRDIVAAHADPAPGRVGGAVVENRIIYRDWAGAGGRIEVRSGLAGVDGRIMRLVHWLLDRDSGRVLAAAEAATVTFDLDRRKSVVITQAARTALTAQVTPGLTL